MQAILQYIIFLSSYLLIQVQNKYIRVDVKTVMDSWTLQTGYPVVEVIRNYTSGTAEVNQYRFLLEKGEDGKDEK